MLSMLRRMERLWEQCKLTFDPGEYSVWFELFERDACSATLSTRVSKYLDTLLKEVPGRKKEKEGCLDEGGRDSYVVLY